MIGTKLAHYEITGHLGSGGMGDVYQATDSKLGRRVAVKFLPHAFVQDANRVVRFEREARVLASLNHPNIAAIYGLEQWQGNKFLIMELVPGETLAERIARGALPLNESLMIAKQIAEALEAAHETGVVHRDLKPANIKAPLEAPVKVLDFGLATAVLEDRDASDPSNSPTLTTAAEAGVILGTASYMSPEQAAGKKVDKRSDIWSFGVVLWETLSGQRLFQGGETVSHILADVLRMEIDFSKVSAPAPVLELLRRCLDRDVKTRLRDIGEARVVLTRALANPESGKTGTEVPRQAAARATWFAWAMAAVGLAAAAGLAWLHFREIVPAPPEVVRFQVPMPPERFFNVHLAVSPNGRYLLFKTTTGIGGSSELWVRSLDSLEARPLAGTERTGSFPFWSPDSRSVVFAQQGKLRRMEISGGLPRTLCDVANFGGGFWTAEGKVVFVDANLGIFQVPEGGGAPSLVLSAESGTGVPVPRLLPDGRQFVYSKGGNEPGVYTASLNVPAGSQQPRKVLDVDGFIAPQYVPSSARGAEPGSGFLLYMRGNTLLAHPFNALRLEVTGEAVPVAEGVSIIGNSSAGIFSAAETGALVYATGTTNRRLTWYDRQGKKLSEAAPPAQWQTLDLSPDGKQVSAGLRDGSGDFLVLIEFARNLRTRLATPVGNGVPGQHWSPDGAQLAYNSNRSGTTRDLYVKPAGSVGGEEMLIRSANDKFVMDWSPDGRYVMYFENDPKTKRDLWLMPMQGERKPEVFLKTEFNESEAQFSPDGRWIAYQSDESGRIEVYVRPFPARPGQTERYPISTSGGHQVRWRGDGKELFYLTPDSKMMSVEISSGPPFRAGTPQFMFQPPMFIPATADSWRWDVTKDGQRLLLVTRDGDEYDPLTVVLNWERSLAK